MELTTKKLDLEVLVIRFNYISALLKSLSKEIKEFAELVETETREIEREVNYAEKIPNK